MSGQQLLTQSTWPHNPSYVIPINLAQLLTAGTSPRSLALGLARLGLRHPELFRCLGQVVRRSGLWSFEDNEAPVARGELWYMKLWGWFWDWFLGWVSGGFRWFWDGI